MSSGRRNRIQGIFQQMGRDKDKEHDKIFRGSDEYLMKNGRLLLEDRITLFDGKTNPIRCFSADELNTITDFNDRVVFLMEHVFCYKGVLLDGRSVLIKVFTHDMSEFGIREIVIATQMSIHKNVQKLIGCCLETEHPVLVYEWVENGFLRDRIMGVSCLVWKERLKIAWEISHTIACLHTGFHRPIIHRCVTDGSVFLDQDNAAKVSNFCLSVLIPQGVTYVNDQPLVRILGYVAPEVAMYNRLGESADVYSFGVLLLVLLTGRTAVDKDMTQALNDWVREHITDDKYINAIVDPTIARNDVVIDEDLEQQLRAYLELALRCTEEAEGSRPTMVDVATELKNMIRSSESLPSTSGHG